MIRKWLLLTLMIAGIAFWWLLDGNRFFSVAFFREIYRETPWLTAGFFCGLYVVVTTFSLPAAGILSVIGGITFGLWTGSVLVSFASAIGATLACLLSRFVFRDWVQHRFGHYLRQVNAGLERDGAWYLFILRLTPVFPYWIINLVFGLTRMRLATYYLVSQAGMLPANVLFVNAGAQLSDVETLSLRGILTPGVFVSLVLLGLFPFIIRAGVRFRQRRAVGRLTSRLEGGADKPD